MNSGVFSTSWERRKIKRGVDQNKTFSSAVYETLAVRVAKDTKGIVVMLAIYKLLLYIFDCDQVVSYDIHQH